jgi:hypothetical protein
MKKGLFILTALSSLLVCNLVYSQSGESKFKMVIINSEEKKITPLFAAFLLTDPDFTDSNLNQYLDGDEDGSIMFYIKNTGTVILKDLSVIVILPDSLSGITYKNNQTLGLINIRDSVLVNIPLAADERVKDGNVQLKIHVSDPYSDSTRTALFFIPTKAPVKIPLLTWVTPKSAVDSVNFSVVKITALVKSRLKITGLKVYINGQVPNDKNLFKTLPTENPNEFRIERTVVLNEGYNEIKIEAKNDYGITISDSRIIEYFNQKIDQTYVERRLALVIGNANYKNSNVLRNPINDAEAITSALRELGFTVLKYLNADLKTMKMAMDEFGERLQKYNVGLFYYAGHGMQVKGNNYLIPVDASLKVEQDVDYDCIDAGRLLGKMDAAGSNTNIVILDACRDNPFSRSWMVRSTRQGEEGLAFMNAPSGTIIAYATSPGRIAADGTGRNGIYTEAILKYIKVPSIPIEDFFKSVRNEVENKTNRTQTPWESTSLKGNFYFKIK